MGSFAAQQLMITIRDRGGHHWAPGTNWDPETPPPPPFPRPLPLVTFLRFPASSVRLGQAPSSPLPCRRSRRPDCL